MIPITLAMGPETRRLKSLSRVSGARERRIRQLESFLHIDRAEVQVGKFSGEMGIQPIAHEGAPAQCGIVVLNGFRPDVSEP